MANDCLCRSSLFYVTFQTLHSFDEMADFEHGEDPLVSMMRKKMGDIDDPNVSTVFQH